MPSKVMMPIRAPALVAVTGANGFIAQHCIAVLLKQGYSVVGTVRSDSKIESVKRVHGMHPKLSVVMVIDITNPSEYLAVLGPLSPAAVLHLAAPFHYNATAFEKEMMVPAVRGSIAILEACARIKSVKRVVHTNSFACIYNAAAGLQPGKVYTAKDWSPLTYQDGVEDAQRADSLPLCPAMVFGPFLPTARPDAISSVNTSNQMVWGVVGAGQDAAIPPTKGPCWVDVRDVAEAHFKALVVPEASGGRFLLTQGVYCNQELADVSRQVSSKYASRIPIGEPGKREADTHYGVDATDTEKVLDLSWRSLEECLCDLVQQLFEIEQQQLKK
ncbi:hypothetical protein NQ176_g3058 [Zarea fungicola]|uniref:Uncharacterized protein n=1 Tax=Zarea fungicola TaxID=93591 RepID=A0ACC1NLH0_9HYPO|nr:hypothetical protein NQ176_g3058 [Lecanicillium fungicola]